MKKSPTVIRGLFGSRFSICRIIPALIADLRDLPLLLCFLKIGIRHRADIFRLFLPWLLPPGRLITDSESV